MIQKDTIEYLELSIDAQAYFTDGTYAIVSIVKLKQLLKSAKILLLISQRLEEFLANAETNDKIADFIAGERTGYEVIKHIIEMEDV